MRCGTFLMFAVALLSASCGDEDPREGDPEATDRSEVTTYRDVGAVCVSPRAAGGDHVQVVLDDCASACAEVRGSCEIVVRDGVIELEASGAATVSDASAPCRAECQPVVAACTLPPLSDGAHVLDYADRSTTVTLPVAEARSEVLSDPDTVGCDAAPLLE